MGLVDYDAMRVLYAVGVEIMPAYLRTWLEDVWKMLGLSSEGI